MAEGQVNANELIVGVEELAKGMADLNKSIKDSIELTLKLQKVFEDQSKSQSDVTKKTNALSTAEKKLTELDKQRIKTAKQLGDVAAKAALLETKEGKKLIAQKLKLAEATRKVRDEQKKGLGITRKSNGLFKSFTKSILASAGALLSIRAGFAVLKKGLGTIIGFEKGMSSVKAITGATDQEFKQLTDSALKLGATTQKSAIQVSGLQKEYAKLGFVTPEIIAATEATISLAIAAESDLAEAATVAASTIRGFGLSATETGRVTDVMAKAFTTTGLNLEKFKVSMANAQVAAKSTGQTLEFTAAALGTIVDTGTDASKAGTDLRNIFGELAKQGITLDQAYDKVNNSSNKVVTAMELVGKRAFSSLITLAENTEKVDELTEAYENSAGAAKEMADIMADNLAGDIELATSAFDGFILSLNQGEGLISKFLRSATQAGTDFLTLITKLNEGESFRLARLKNIDDFEKVINETRLKSIKVIERRAELENKTQEEITNNIIEENELRIKSLDEQSKGLEDEQKARAEFNRDVLKEINILLANKIEADKAGKEAGIQAAEEEKRAKIALMKEEEEERAKFRAKINEKKSKENFDFAEEELDLFISNLEKEEKALTDSIERQAEIKVDGLTESEKATKEASEKRKGLEEFTEEKIEELKAQIIDSAGQVATDRFNARIDNELNALRTQSDIEQKILQEKLDNKIITEDEFAKQSKAISDKLLVEEAKAQKKKDLFQVGIDTLTAVIKTFATFGFPAGAIPAAIIGGIGAAQAVEIAAKPLPKFRFGGYMSETGPAEFSEEGSELFRLPNGKEILSPEKKTIGVIPEGTRIFSHSSPETQAAINGGITPEMFDRLISEEQKTRSAILKMRSSGQSFPSDRLMKRIVKNGNTSEEWINKYMRGV